MILWVDTKTPDELEEWVLSNLRTQNWVGGFETLVAFGGSEALDVVVSEPVDCILLDLEMASGTDPELDIVVTRPTLE